MDFDASLYSVPDTYNVLVMADLCLPLNIGVEVPTSSTLECDVFGERTIQKVIMLK